MYSDGELKIRLFDKNLSSDDVLDAMYSDGELKIRLFDKN